MSKKNKGRSATAQRVSAPAKRVRTNDNYSNSFSRLGFGQPNLMETADYPITRLTQDYAKLNSLYRNDWIANKIIDSVAEDMTKNWYELSAQLAPDAMDKFKAAERKTQVRQRILEGIRWARLFGGAAGVMVIEGQEDMLEEPLDLRMITPDSFKGIIIADRWSGVYPDTTLVQDLTDPDFGTPEYYNFAMNETDLANGIRVHHSRVLRFTGRDLPYIERMSESHWGMSELEHVYTELTKRNTTSENVANLVFQANLKTYKMSDLGQLLAATDANLQGQLYQTLTMQNFLMSNMGMNVMDKEDEFQTSQYTFSGLSEIYDAFMQDIAGAAEIPATRLFGRSPAGMNATGESDLTNYYDKIAQLQEAKLRPVLEKLLPIMCLSTFGKLIENLDIKFNPVAETSEQERSALIQQSSGAIIQVFQSGLISQRTALKELRQSGVALNMWSNITDEDIENAETDTNPQGEEGGDMMGGMGDMMGGEEAPEAPQGQPDPMQMAQMMQQSKQEAPQKPQKPQKPQEQPKTENEGEDKPEKYSALKRLLGGFRSKGGETSEQKTRQNNSETSVEN